MTRPFLSIVTISFNQAPYLRQCVDSVVSQKGDDVEYIVVDPGSTDGSREILDGYGSQIDHLVLEPDKGPADGLNKGFALAAGEIGYFINSDDFLLPGAIERMRRLWAERPEMDVLLGGGWMVDGNGEPLRELTAGLVSLPTLLSGEARLVQQGMSFRMSRFREIRGFRNENRTCWDHELLCYMAVVNARIETCQHRLGAFRIYTDSISGGIGGEAHTRHYLDDLDRIHRQIAGQPRPSRDLQIGALSRLQLLVRRPRQSLAMARDRLFPRAMRQRWRNDIGRSSATNS